MSALFRFIKLKSRLLTGRKLARLAFVLLTRTCSSVGYAAGMRRCMGYFIYLREVVMYVLSVSPYCALTNPRIGVGKSRKVAFYQEWGSGIQVLSAHGWHE
jgi:hypothetical protein